MRLTFLLKPAHFEPKPEVLVDEVSWTFPFVVGGCGSSPLTCRSLFDGGTTTTQPGAGLAGITAATCVDGGEPVDAASGLAVTRDRAFRRCAAAAARRSAITPSAIVASRGCGLVQYDLGHRFAPLDIGILLTSAADELGQIADMPTRRANGQLAADSDVISPLSKITHTHTHMHTVVVRSADDRLRPLSNCAKA